MADTLEDLAREVVRLDEQDVCAECGDVLRENEEGVETCTCCGNPGEKPRHLAGDPAPRLARAFLAILPAIERLREADDALVGLVMSMTGMSAPTEAGLAQLRAADARRQAATHMLFAAADAASKEQP